MLNQILLNTFLILLQLAELVESVLEFGFWVVIIVVILIVIVVVAIVKKLRGRHRPGR